MMGECGIRESENRKEKESASPTDDAGVSESTQVATTYQINYPYSNQLQRNGCSNHRNERRRY